MNDLDMDDIQKRFFVSLGLIWGVVLVARPFTKVTINYADFSANLYLSLICACFSLLAGRFGLNLLRGLASLIAGLLLIMLPMVTANYMAMSLDMPLADELLANMDAAIGFDWHSFIAFVDARPLLAAAFGEAYQSFLIQVVLVPALLLWLGYSRRAHAFMIAFGLLTLVAAVVAIWFPAYGTYTHYGYTDGQLANINSYFGFEFIEHFEAVRNNVEFHISSQGISGILTFPSVHAGVAYLLIWATWTNIWLRYPFLLLNIMMALAAVVNANHYLVDILASIPLAALCIGIVRLVFGMHRNAADPAVSSQPGMQPVHFDQQGSRMAGSGR
ncbi:phosphatase PAP2 family protein [Hoeflea sp. G2-23]|uniref:Phosphatase PAP2 family protein n=1 Tax=Hoeflea algicola TaxID=2983763 RepID=A0ABT3ZBI5_9HYPH|nr:phosphatase PAP2 family protein [Hoeflea algicola]MCY0149078.1 phosphatase PAP2 family protein [Hoeflea algicola]